MLRHHLLTYPLELSNKLGFIATYATNAVMTWHHKVKGFLHWSQKSREFPPNVINGHMTNASMRTSALFDLERDGFCQIYLPKVYNAWMNTYDFQPSYAMRNGQVLS